jgi:4-diphosphocytidyl-2C-methyl-D-erythritol kinase
MSRRLRALAPAKINLGLFVGPKRKTDSRHELVSVMQSISLADVLTLEVGQPGGGEDGGGEDGRQDEVFCPGVQGPPGENLAAVALRLFRDETAWDGPPLRLTIDKHIPVAAGLGGGSADAAAALRLARHVSGRGSPELLHELAVRLGADVPAQLAPGRWLATGAGERLGALEPASRPFGVLVLPAAAELSAGAVYARLDEMRGEGGAKGRGEAGREDSSKSEGTRARAYARASSALASAAKRQASEGDHDDGDHNVDKGRSSADLAEVERRLRAAYGSGAAIAGEPELSHNDLQAPAIALCPGIEVALDEALGAGADVAFVSGSGPTVVGLFTGANAPDRARHAAAGLAGREPPAGWATPVVGGPAAVNDLDVRHNPTR